MKTFKLLSLGLALGMAYICYATEPDTFNSNTDQSFKTDNSFKEDHQTNYTQQLNKLTDAIKNPNSLFGKVLSENQMNEFVKLIEAVLSFENIKEIVEEVLETKEELLKEIPKILSTENIEKAATMISNIKEDLIHQIDNAAKEATEIITECKEPLLNTISSIDENKIYKIIEGGINIITDESPLLYPSRNLSKLSKAIASIVEAFPKIKPEKYLKKEIDIYRFVVALLIKAKRKFLERLESRMKLHNEPLYQNKAAEIDLLSSHLAKIMEIGLKALLDLID
ncbi:MAG: hypothetical protein ACLRFH_02050 [Opitutales bacterium]